MRPSAPPRKASLPRSPGSTAPLSVHRSKISYDVFKWQRELDLRGLRPDMLALTAVRPIDHFNGIHTGFAEISTGESVAPFKTVKDYENGLGRIDDFVKILDRSILRMREGLASGVVQPKLVMDNVVEQLDAMLAEGVEGSSFMKPLTTFPADISAADQARLKAAYTQSISTEIRPALTRLRTFIATEYLPKARTSVGLGDMPGGEKLYAYLVESSTTTNLTPDQIHSIGLSEVTRLQAEMEKVKDQVGFKGTLQAILRAHPHRSQVQAGVARMAAAELCGDRQKARRDAAENVRDAAQGAARHPAGSRADRKRRRARVIQPRHARRQPPGHLLFQRLRPAVADDSGMETLYLHEGAPGHHFQISLAQENEALPKFQRFGGNTAYAEGWGLYAETFGRELGVYTDPYQYFGYLDSQLFRAIRLVVDTGIHSKGWTRDQTIKYILDNSSRGLSNATAETERYIAIPGQALAYKIGQLKISELRARAEKALGAKFDIREFHEQVLGTGALPLAVLEAKIDDWIASKSG